LISASFETLGSYVFAGAFEFGAVGPCAEVPPPGFGIATPVEDAVGRGGGGGGAARDVAERFGTAPLDNDADNDDFALNFGGALPVEREPSLSPKLLKKSSDVSAILENNFNSIPLNCQHVKTHSHCTLDWSIQLNSEGDRKVDGLCAMCNAHGYHKLKSGEDVFWAERMT
jgi:hypothetical protein